MHVIINHSEPQPPIGYKYQQSREEYPERQLYSVGVFSLNRKGLPNSVCELRIRPEYVKDSLYFTL